MTKLSNVLKLACESSVACRILQVFRRIWAVSAEFLEFCLHTIVFGMGLWLYFFPGGLNGQAFSAMRAVQDGCSLISWSWVFMIVGAQGLISLFWQCKYYLRLFAVFVQWCLWIYTLTLVMQTKPHAWIIVFFHAMLALSLIASIKVSLKRPRRPRTLEAVERYYRISGMRGVHVQ